MRTRVLTCLALLTACGPSMQSESSLPGVMLAVEPGTATAGDTVNLVLNNSSEDTIGYNLCASGLERRQDDSWAIIPSERMCTMELRILEPGGETSYPVDLPDTLSTGEYRYTTSIELMEGGGNRGVPSEPFSVR